MRPAPRSTAAHRSATATPIRAPEKISVASRRGQRLDLLGAIERAPNRPPLLEPAPLTPRRVAIDQLPLDGDVEDLRKPLNRLVDRGRVDRPLADLQLPVAVDLGDRDLGERVLGEVRQQVLGQLPLVVEEGVGREPLGLHRFEPLGRELMERRLVFFRG